MDEQITIKDPKRVEQGKRLAEHNRKRREEFKHLKDQQVEALVMQVKEEGRSKMTIPIVLIAITIAGVGSYFYLRQPKKQQPSSSNKPKILSRLKKINGQETE